MADALRTGRPGRLTRRTPCGLIAVLLLGTTSLSAQDPTVRAYLDRDAVGLGEQFTLSVEISGGDTRLASDPVLPETGSFATLLSSGSSRRIEIVNGRTSISRTLDFRFLTTAEGTFEIGPVTVSLDGRVLRSDPIKLVVRSGGAPSRRPGRGPPSSRRGGREIAPEDLFMRATVDKRRVFVNQPVIVEYKLYTRVTVTSFNPMQLPATTGFWAEDFPLPQTPRTSVEVIDGRRYTVATLKKMALFPTSPGSRTVGPFGVDAEVRINRRSPFSSRRDPFDDFFRGGSIFGRTVTKRISSESLDIEAVPLPEKGKPPGFSGLVGSLAIAASVDKAVGRTNQALTLEVTLSGQGNLRTLPEPEIRFPADFEVYAPQTTEETSRRRGRIGGKRTYEYVMIPRTPGQKVIPAISMAYFDADAKTYRTVRSEPLEIAVSGDPVVGPVVAAGGQGGIRLLRQDIRFIDTGTAALRPIGTSLFGTPFFWLILAFPPLVVAGAFALRRHQDRLLEDRGYARQRRASRAVRKRLARARSALGAGSGPEFYSEAGKALLGFLGDKLNIAEAGLLSDEVRRRLEADGVSEDVVGLYFDCLETCDRQRFSPSDTGEAEMSAFLKSVEGAITELDREVSK